MVDQILAAYAVVCAFWERKTSCSASWRPDTDPQRSLLPPLLPLRDPQRRGQVRWLRLRRDGLTRAVETAGEFFSQDNPVIRDITQRVQAMCVF